MKLCAKYVIDGVNKNLLRSSKNPTTYINIHLQCFNMECFLRLLHVLFASRMINGRVQLKEMAFTPDSNDDFDVSLSNPGMMSTISLDTIFAYK